MKYNFDIVQTALIYKGLLKLQDDYKYILTQVDESDEDYICYIKTTLNEIAKTIEKL